MADRRIARAQRRLDADPPSLSAGEYAALRNIKAGGVSNEKWRKRLVSRGLLSSNIGSRALLTQLAHKAITRREMTRLCAQ